MEKFDGRRDRRLTIAEMAQIAGHKLPGRDGTFGTLGLGGATGQRGRVNAIEEHRFRPLDHLWRSAELDYSSVTDLIASLEVRSDDPLLKPAQLAIDLAVLKLIAEDPAIAATRGPRRASFGRCAACRISARSGQCTTRAWSAACSTTLEKAAIFRTNGSLPR
jgi:ATP-dependent RNA helicase SUPV3L1/SUV3